MIVLHDEMEIACFASDDRALVFNSALLQTKTSRTAQGVNVMALKAKRSLTGAAPVKETHIQNVSRYRARSLPAAGALLKPEDRGEEQMSLIEE